MDESSDQEAPHADEVAFARKQLEAPVRTEFKVSDMHIVGKEEERFPDDHPAAELRGRVKQHASVDLVFDQSMAVPFQHAGETTMLKLIVSQFIARDLSPEMVIEACEYAIEEARRVQSTRKEQPLQSDGLVMAGAGTDLDAVARELSNLKGGPNDSPG